MEEGISTNPQQTDQGRMPSVQRPASTVGNGHWVQYPRPNPDALMCLFCFPSAGGGATMYRHWPRQLLPGLEVCCVQLPGRENRLREQPFDQLCDLLPKLTEAILPHLNRPFAFFGHSMLAHPSPSDS